MRRPALLRMVAPVATLVVLVLGVLLGAPAAQAAGPGSFTQAQVNAGIAAGVGYYDSIAQQPNGSWDSGGDIPVPETAFAVASYGVLDNGNYNALTAAQQTRVRNGVAYLLSTQLPDGSFHDSGSSIENYETSLTLIALSLSGNVPTTPPGAIATAIANGRSFLISEQKIPANGFSCQTTGPSGSGLGGQGYCGGWSYRKSSDAEADESNTGFALTGLDLTGGVPAAAASANLGWQTNIQSLIATNPNFAPPHNDGGGSYVPGCADGGCGDFSSNANDTGSMLFSFGYDGLPASDSRVVAGVKFGNDVIDEYELMKATTPRVMVYHTGNAEDGTCTIGSGGCDWAFGTGEGGYHYSMFGLEKGLAQFVTPNLSDPNNFYAKIVDLLLTNQNPDGSWPVDPRDDASPLVSTGFSVLALALIGAPPSPPGPGGGGNGGVAGNGGGGGNGGNGPLVTGIGGPGGNAGPCGGGGAGAGGLGAGGGGAGGGGCFNLIEIQGLASGAVAATAGVATNNTSIRAEVLADLGAKNTRARAAKRRPSLTLIGQKTMSRLGIGRYKVVVRLSAKARKAFKRLRKVKVTVRLRMTAPTGRPLSVTRTVTLRR